MSKIKNIIIHCTDSVYGNRALITQWHLNRGFRTIGYHEVICNGRSSPKAAYVEEDDGKIEIGRPLDADDEITGDEIGAHAIGHNKDSIGIVLVGKKDFSNKQLSKLRDRVEQHLASHRLDIDAVKGHYEFDSGKTCPNMPMNEVRRFLNGQIEVEELQSAILQHNGVAAITDKEIASAVPSPVSASEHKPGVKSTEFWATMAVIAASSIVGSGLAPTHPLVQIAGIVAAVLSGLGYGAQRARLKGGK